MKILIVSVNYGAHAGPEGICTQRLASSLIQQNRDVNVLSKRSLRWHAPHGEERAFRSLMHTPYHVQTSIGQLLLDAPVPLWDWVLRVERARLRQPLLVYARGLPLTSLVAGYRLASRLSAPLVAHFRIQFLRHGRIFLPSSARVA